MHTVDVPVRFPKDAIMAPPAFMRQVRAWALSSFCGERSQDGRVIIRVIRQDHSTLRFGRSAIETPLRIGDRRFARGLGVHAVSEIDVDVPAGAAAFEASVGVDNNADTGGVRGSVEFALEVDGAEMLRSPVVKCGAPPLPLMVRLPGGARELRMKVGDGGDGVAYDQADWADAAFVMRDGSRRYLDIGQTDLLLTEDAVPFTFTLGGQPSRELLGNWQLSHETVETTDSTNITAAWQQPGPGLRVTADVRVFKRYPAVDWVIRFENRGSADTAILEDVRALDARLASGYARLPLTLHHLNGDTCSATSFAPLQTVVEPGKAVHWAPTGGRPSSLTAFPFWNMQYHDQGAIVGLGWTGQWCADFARTPTGPASVRAGMEVLKTVLRPGESIRTPRILVMPWQGAKDEAQVRFRRLMLECYAPRHAGKLQMPPVAIQTFDRYNGRPEWATESGQLVYAAKAKELGFDSVWLDAAWFPGGFPNGVGNWSVDPKRFPRGLKPVSDAVHANNQRFVLWFEPERVAAGSEIAREHPEWVHGGASGGLYKLDVPEARHWMTERLTQLITDCGVDVYRNDFNIDPLPFWRAADAPDRQGITEIRYVEGLYEMWDTIRRRFPGILIDNCSSGGRRLDLEMTMRALPLWRSDTGCWAGHPEWNQMQSITLGQYLPIYTVGLWSDDPYERRSAATAGASCEVPYLSPDFDASKWRQAVREITDWRKYWLGDMYPLCGGSVALDQLAGWQLHRPDLDEGLVVCFRRSDCGIAGVIAQVRGVRPTTEYMVEYVPGSGRRTQKVMTGKQLLDGLSIVLPGRPDATVVLYRPAAKPATTPRKAGRAAR